MDKSWLAKQCANLTIIVGCMTNFQTKCTRFASKTSSTELYYLFLNEYRKKELVDRIEKLIAEIDTECHSFVLHEDIQLKGGVDE